jgi:hypothetical protein
VAGEKCRYSLIGKNIDLPKLRLDNLLESVFLRFWSSVIILNVMRKTGSPNGTISGKNWHLHA